MKKALSVLLAALMLLSLAASASAVCTCENTPVIYVEGVKGLVHFREDGTKEVLLENDSDVIADIAGDLWQDALKALVTGEWDSYCDIAYEKCKTIYAHCGPDENGEPLPDTAISYTDGTLIPAWTYDSVSSYHSVSTTDFNFRYDWRKSPMEIADELHDYIEIVKEKTGHDKVSIISRCIGTIPVFAYLYKYERPVDYADIEKTVFLNGCMDGMPVLEALLSGSIELNAQQIYTFTKSKRAIESLPDEFSEILVPAFDLLTASRGLDGACSMVNNIYANVKDKLIARLLRDYYGTALCYVACVNERYEQYKDYIFAAPEDKEHYKNLIAKADDYHYNVQPEISNMIAEMTAFGKPAYIVCEYGFMQYPLSADCSKVGDHRVCVVQQSLGATVSDVNTVLPDEYIAARTKDGFGKYISPDKQIDASTGICPDTTWYIKNLDHLYPAAVVSLCQRFIRTDNFTIDSDPDCPQFLNFIQDIRGSKDLSYFVPAQAINENDTEFDFELSFFSSFTQFFTIFFAKLTAFLRILLEAISQLVISVKG